MKCSEVARFVQQVEAYIRHPGGQTEPLAVLVELLSVEPAQTCAKLCAALNKLSDVPDGPGGATAAQASLELAALQKLLTGVGKPAVLKDLADLNKALDGKSTHSIGAIILALQRPSASKSKPSRAVATPVQEELVRKYCAALEGSLGDDEGFMGLFSHLQADPLVSPADIIAVAKRFAFATVKSRKGALEKILLRHKSLMISRAKSAATAGRIAG